MKDDKLWLVWSIKNNFFVESTFFEICEENEEVQVIESRWKGEEWC